MQQLLHPYWHILGHLHSLSPSSIQKYDTWQWVCIFHPVHHSYPQIMPTYSLHLLFSTWNSPLGGRVFPLVTVHVSSEQNEICLIEKVIIDLTDQFCNLFLNDLFELDVVYLVVAAELLCNSGFANSWRSNKADSNRLQMWKKCEKIIRGTIIC